MEKYLEYIKYIPAVLLAVYLLVINVVAVLITIKDKNIAIANGKLEEAASGKGGKGSNKKSSSGGKSGKGSSGKKNSPAKAKSKSSAKPQRRIPEKTLLIIAALGGSIAMILTMRTIRHKTKHNKFMVGIPLIIVAQSVLAVALALYLLR